MSDKEEKDTNSEDESSKIPVIITKGKVITVDSSNSSAISEKMLRSAAAEGSGVDTERIFQDNLKKLEETEAGTGSGDHIANAKVSEIYDKKFEDKNIDNDAKTPEINVTFKKAESSFPFLHKCDEIDLKKADDHDEIDDEDIELRWEDDENPSSPTYLPSGDNNGNGDAKNDDILPEDQLLEASSDVIAEEMSDMHSEIPKSSENNIERDMLKDNSEENILSEDKSAKEIETTKESKIHQKLDISLEMAEDEKSLEDELLKEPDLDTEAINSPEMDYDLLQERENLNTEAINSPEMDFEVLQETDLNAEAINSPELDSPIERSVENVLEDKLLEESEVHVTAETQEILGEKSMVEKLEKSEKHSALQVMADVESVLEEVEDSEIKSIKEVIAEAKEIFGENQIVKEVWESEINSAKQVISEAKTLLKEQSMVKEVGESEIDTEFFGEKSVVEPIKETESVEIDILKEVTTDKHTKDVSEGIMEDQLLAESESTAETETTFFKMPSLTDVISNKVNDDVMLKENLLKQSDPIIESLEIARKEVPDKEDDDVLLEDKLLEETETALAIPESDATMEIDDDKEGELLKDDDYQDDSCTPMDVDVTDQLQLQIGDQAKIEGKIIDQPMDNQSEIENKDIVHSIDDQTNIENVDKDESDCSLVLTTSVDDEVKSKEQSDDQAKTTEKTIDQPTDQSTSTVLVVSSVENTTKAVAVIIDTPIKEKAVEKVIDTAKSEMENIDQLIDDENNITEQSIKSPEQTGDITVSSTPNVLTENLDKSILENSTLETQINVKIEPEEIRESEKMDMDLNNPKNIKETVNPVTILDKNNDTDEVSPKNSSIFFEDAPVPIKIEHGLHKPDVMIEIPTQELIDMDDTDFSMNLDQSDVMMSLNDVYENFDEDLELEKTVDETISDDKTVNEKSEDKAINDDTVNDIPVNQKASVDKTVADDDTVKKKSVDQKTVVTETTIVTEDVTANDNDIPVDRQASVDKTVVDDDTVKEKSVDQITVVTETTIVTEDVTDNDIPVDQQASADKTVAEDDTVKEKSVDQESVVTETISTEDDTENDKSAKQKAETAIVTDDITVKEKSVDQEAIVTESTVIEVQKDSDIMENEKIVEDTVVQPTIEDNMTKMFAEDEPEVAKEVSECVASTSQAPLPAEHPPPPTQMTPDTSDEVPEVSDSLGLLAESAGRMMEDDEEPDEDDEGDDDDDFDNDESSNQISAEQSEDSNPAALDAEPAAEQEDKDLETPDPKDDEFMICDSSSQDETVKMDVEVAEGELFGTVQIQAETVNEMNEEAMSAVDALLNADKPASEQDEANQEPTMQMDEDTVRLSDASDNEIDVEPTQVQTVAETSKEGGEQTPKQSPSKSPQTSPKKSPSKPTQSPSKSSPSKMKNLAISAQGARSVVNIVDLEESSSSEDDLKLPTEIQEVQKQTDPDTTTDDKPPSPDSDVTNVNIPTGIEIMCTSGGTTSEITTKEGEVTISGVPKPPPHKPARLNTSEVSIKTVSVEPMVIPETEINDQSQTPTQSQPKLSLEIFSLDSDDEDSVAKDPQKMTALELEKARETSKCINYCCKSDGKVPYKMADASVVAYYDAGRKRRSMVCQPCADVVADRTKNLVQGIKDLTPLLQLEMSKLSQDLVEISDSESEDEDMSSDEPKETIGEKGAEFVENNLAKFLNDTWKKYDMDVRLKETQLMLDDEIEKLEQDSKEIDAMLNECQVATDKLRCELYATFQCRRQEQAPLVIFDTLEKKYIGLEEQENAPAVESIETRQNKRRLSSTSDTPAKRPAIPLGYAPLDGGDKEKAAIPAAPDTKIDDDKDISVVKLSAEAAPAELPPPGEISRPPLRVGMPVYAMKNAFGPWLKGKVLDIQPKNPGSTNPFSLCRVKFDHKKQTNGKVLLARCIAYSEPADVRMTIGTRLIALFKDTNKRESYYSGVVAEIPNPVNNYRYLVFFDDGYAQYVQHQYTRLVCESSNLVWEEVHPFSREFVKEYLMAYPERPMVRLHEGQHLKTEWNGKWWSSRVTRVDASLAQVMFVGDGRREWIYRGSTRLAPLYLELRAAERHRPRPMPRSKAQPRFNMPYVEYTRSVEQVDSNKQADTTQTQRQQQVQILHQQIQSEEIRRQRAVAKKSTSATPQAILPTQQSVQPPHTDNLVTNNVTSRVVYYTPKNAVRPHKMVPHRCGPKCKRSDVLSLKELRTYNPLAKPLLSGWERQIVRFKGHKEVMYRAPCGRRLRSMRELHNYLRTTESDLPVDLFDFHYSTHCLAEFVVTKCLVGKKDLSHGKENVPVPCVNYYDDSLPEFCSYNTERTPTAGVPLNLDPEFLCGCDCTDDCQDKSKCACWKMTLEGARTIGLYGPNVGYAYKRLPEPLPSGIYECNSRCKCRHTCLNRVAQHPLQLKLQVFKTQNRGWGIRALNDVPKGSFLCVYAGNLLTDATANLDGLNEGDEYLAELDYIEVVEQMKEGYEEDIPDADKKLDKKEGKGGDDSDDPSSSEDEETASKTDKEDDDFQPGYIGLGVTEFSKRLRRREKSKKDKQNTQTDEKEKEKDTPKETKENAEEDCITISDDEEVREPSRFMAQTTMGANEYISKYKSVRTLFGKDEACYIMDAKVQGNIGRYLNHSCCPNVFVQNVFVDTHDPRFPWVAFFALSHIKAGTELTWNYNYDVGSVPGKILYCFCQAPNCRGRLL